MTTVHRSTAEKRPRIRRTPGRSILATGGLLTACAIACSLPVLLSAGVLAGIGLALAGWLVPAGLILLVLIAGFLMRRRHRAARTSATRGCTCENCRS